MEDKRIDALEKRVAALEKQIQGQPGIKKKMLGFVDGKVVNYSE